MAREYRPISIEAPDFGAVVDFLDHCATVKVYLDHTHSPPTLRIEVTAGPSDEQPSSLYQDFAVELPERAAPEPDEDEDEERHIVGYDEDGDPILELGPGEPGQVPAQDE